MSTAVPHRVNLDLDCEGVGEARPIYILSPVCDAFKLEIYYTEI